MGMLQLAGIVSGGGKAINRSLDNLQVGMIQSQLQKERNDSELERLRLTFGHDTGVINLKQGHTVTNIGLEQKGKKELQEQADTAATERVGMQTKSAETIEDKQQTGANTRTDKTIENQREMQGEQLDYDKGKSRQDRQLAREIEDKKEKFVAGQNAKDWEQKRGMQREDIGKEIVVSMQRLQAIRERGANGRAGGRDYLDPSTEKLVDAYIKQLDGLNDVIKTSLSKPQKEAAERRAAEVMAEVRGLLGFEPETKKPKTFVDPG